MFGSGRGYLFWGGRRTMLRLPSEECMSLSLVTDLSLEFLYEMGGVRGLVWRLCFKANLDTCVYSGVLRQKRGFTQGSI